MSLIGAETFKWEDIGQADQHHVPHVEEHQVQRQHRGARGRDRGLLQGRQGARVHRPARQVRPHIPERAHSRRDRQVPVGRPAAGRGRLPPEAGVRRQVRQQAAVPVQGQGLRHGQPARVRRVQVQGRLASQLRQPVRRDVQLRDERRGRGAHQGADGHPASTTRSET